MGRKEMIRADMESVGTYNPIYDKTIAELAKQERELSRAEKTWRENGGQMVAELVNKTGGRYMAKDPYFSVVEDLRKNVTALKNQLGLTPAGLSKVRAKDRETAKASKLEELLADAKAYAIDHAEEYQHDMDDYCRGVSSGDIAATVGIRQAVDRYLKDLASGKWDFRSEEANEIIAIIETTLCHRQGEALDGTPLRGKPFLLMGYHKFCVYNLLGFWLPGANERRFNEGQIYVPRKNVKTTFAAALCWALSLEYRASGSKAYEVGAALKQALEGFDFLKYNVKRLGLTTDDDPANGLRIIDNNMEHSISGDIGEGFISINALASSTDKQDSFNCNFIIADEEHTYKGPKQYQILKDATKAYTNKLVLGISTAGDNALGYLAQRLKYLRGILDGTITGDAADRIFAFLAEAPLKDDGQPDYTNPAVLAACNPGWGESIRPQDMINDAAQAEADPQLRPEFFAKSLNVFTASVKAWFDVEEFRASDTKYSWSIAELAKLPIKWFGGSDLSKLYDLTASCLFGNYKGVDIIIPHCWFPKAAAAVKAQEDQIPLFGWMDDGWLDMTNAKVVNHSDVVKWYKERRAQGFKLKRIGHDRKFCREYYIEMKKEHFPIVDQPQLYLMKSEGFRYLEKSAKAGTLYYCHAEPFEYCVQNVHAVEKADDAVMYDKLEPNLRIDVFDCAVFAACAYLKDLETKSRGSGWNGGDGKDGDTD